MGLFNKNKNNDYDDYDYEYMDNSESYGFKYSSKDDYNEYQDSDYCNDYYSNNYNNHNYNCENPYDKNIRKENKRNNKYKNKCVNKTRKFSKKKTQEDYGYTTGFEDEQIYYDEDGIEVINKNKIDIKTIAFRTCIFFYLLFALLGAVGTTFSDGYKAQVVTSTIRGERITYDKCLKQLEFLEELDDFGGVSELQELYKTGNFQARIAPLKSSLSKVNKKIAELTNAAYKTSDKNYVNVEMLDMIRDLMNTKQQTLKMTISYYESLSGYSSNADDLDAAQTKLLEQHQVYKNKLSNYKIRFEQLKTYELKLEK